MWTVTKLIDLSWNKLTVTKIKITIYVTSVNGRSKDQNSDSQKGVCILLLVYHIKVLHSLYNYVRGTSFHNALFLLDSHSSQSVCIMRFSMRCSFFLTFLAGNQTKR